MRVFILCAVACCCSALRVPKPHGRRGLLARVAAASLSGGLHPSLCGAYVEGQGTLGYVDDSGMKSYSQVQRAWEKSATMTQREMMLQARGANPTPSSNESEKSRKRRAMAGCHDETFREAAGYSKEAECNARVLGGDVDFMLDAMARGG